jgi:hypothetical protein
MSREAALAPRADGPSRRSLWGGAERSPQPWHVLVAAADQAPQPAAGIDGRQARFQTQQARPVKLQPLPAALLAPAQGEVPGFAIASLGELAVRAPEVPEDLAGSYGPTPINPLGRDRALGRWEERR